VDQEAKQKKLRRVEDEGVRKIAEQEERLNKKIEELEAKDLEEELKIKEVNELRAKSVEKKERLEEELKASIAELESLQPRKLLNEEGYRRLKDKYGDIFEAGMGAEAILQVLKQIDVDALHQELRDQVRSTSGDTAKGSVNGYN